VKDGQGEGEKGQGRKGSGRCEEAFDELVGQNETFLVIKWGILDNEKGKCGHHGSYCGCLLDLRKGGVLGGIRILGNGLERMDPCICVWGTSTPWMEAREGSGWIPLPSSSITAGVWRP